jgi:lipopolysaccharide transport system ATP-binding protein
MSEETIIKLRNVSKCFKRYHHPGDRLKEIIIPGKNLAAEFWALRDINLELTKGHTLGIVGRNGSGKSTLLQIIVGTLTPTKGEVQVKGRISALLELGSGFNPEFTGRQNVFFNGQLLGLKTEEIAQRFDDIASFADIGDFMEQPVKTYSSGMFVRLGFAVATSVDPDVLVVDEALSVGDEAFQRKCFARIQTIQEKGGTILFVSHAASSVVQLCDTAILLDHGELLMSHQPKYVVSKYQKLIYASPDKVEGIRQEIRDLKTVEEPSIIKEGNNKANELDGKHELKQEDDEPETLAQRRLKIELDEIYDPEMTPSNTIIYPSRGAKIIDPRITTPTGQIVNHLVGRKEYIYTYSVYFSRSTEKVRFGMLIKTISGFELAGTSFHSVWQDIKYIEAGSTVNVQFKFKCMLNQGVYFLNAGVTGLVDEELTYLARCIDVAMFRVQPCPESFGTAVVDLLVEPCLNVQKDVIHKETLIDRV